MVIQMNEYHKIHTVFKRDPATKYKTLLICEWTLPEFAFLAKNQWDFSEKLDGTNIRVMFSGGKVTFGGKTDRAQIPAQLTEKLIERFYEQTSLFETLFSDADVCLYGEGIGPKIQKGGGNYRKYQDFVLFDVKIGEWWLQRKDVQDIADSFGVEIAPIIGAGTLYEMVYKVKDGLKSTWGDFQAEGIVARPTVELKNRAGNRIITKVKCRDFI